MKGNTKASTPKEYFDSLAEPRKAELKALDKLIRKAVPKLKPFMLSGMLAYGKFHYKYASGREGDWAVISLASQKNYISLYICAVDGKKYLAETYKKTLPKASIGKSCVRFKKLEDVDLAVIEEMVKKAAKLGGASQQK